MSRKIVVALFGREFMRHRPARRARNKAEPRLQRDVVDLVDDAVDVIAERRATRFDRAIMREHVLGVLAERRQRIDRQAERRNASITPSCVFAGSALVSPQRIGEEMQGPCCGDRRIELAQRACGGVARIGEDRLAAVSFCRSLSAAKSLCVI